MHRALRHLSLVLILLAPAAAAQIDVAVSPFPVQQSPAAYQAFGDEHGGVWTVFLGAQAGSALYAQHVLANGAYAAGFSSAALAVTHSDTQVNAIMAAPDGVGGALILWFGVNPLDASSPFIALRCQHLDMEGRPQYPDTGVVVSSIASAAMLVSDHQGGAYVAWEELKSVSNPDIVAQHFGYFGTPLWVPSGSPTGRNVCAVIGLQKLRAMQEDGAGGAFVVWADSRTGGTSPLYGMRLLSAGVAAAPWTSNGVRLTPITAGIRIVGAAPAPGSGLCVAWRDIAIANQFAAQRLASDGSLLWPAAGAIVATVTPQRADFVPASSGDMLVTWGGSDIRCARLNATGANVWPEADGRVLLTPPTALVNLRAATDGAGGQRLAWSYDNAGQNDVNTLRVDGAGAPAPGEPPAGDPFATTAQTEEPVAWLNPSTSQPAIVWLAGGVMYARLPSAAALGVSGDAAHAGIALAPPSPNPSRGGALSLRFVAAAGPARLELFDTAGRRVWVRALDSAGGAQAVRLDDAAPPAPGVYTLRLSAAGRSATQRLVRVE